MNAQIGIALNLTIGQHVRHRDYRGRRVTGIVKGLSIDTEGSLQADIVLDAPIVIEAGEGRPLDIWRQCVPVHELAPFDARDELISEMLIGLRAALAYNDGATLADGSGQFSWAAAVRSAVNKADALVV